MSQTRGLRAYGLETPQEEHWSELALCASSRVDPEWWYSDDLGDKAEAVSWCHVCSVRVDCLADALESERDTSRAMLFGIRAGLLAKQRWRLYRGQEAGPA